MNSKEHDDYKLSSPDHGDHVGCDGFRCETNVMPSKENLRKNEFGSLYLCEKCIDSYDEKIEVCKGCEVPTEGRGPDGISYCPECEHIVEGATTTMKAGDVEGWA